MERGAVCSVCGAPDGWRIYRHKVHRNQWTDLQGAVNDKNFSAQGKTIHVRWYPSEMVGGPGHAPYCTACAIRARVFAGSGIMDRKCLPLKSGGE
jgi:hypothetical protein